MGFKEYPRRLNYEDVEAYTDNFSDQNYIGDFQFGKVYHGKITLPHSAKPKLVTVKVWQIPEMHTYFPNDNAHRLMDELNFLQNYDHSFPGFMKVYGYCLKREKCGIVYDFKAYNTLFNLVPTDEFKWWQRIKVALRFAELLRYLHVNYNGESPLLIRNIHPAHVMVDEDWNPILYDFGLISGGMFLDKLQFRIQHVRGCRGYFSRMGDGTQSSDVYAFGIVLLTLIMKEVYTDEDREKRKLTMKDRALCKQTRDRKVFRKSKVKYRSDLLWYEEDEILAEINDENFHFSVVHKSLEADESFYARDGPTITRLALACVEYFPEDRPTMNQVVKRLQRLQVVRQQPQLNGYIERKKDMKKEVKRENIASGKVKIKKENISSRKMELEREDIAPGKVKMKKESISSRKMELKREGIAPGKVKEEEENIRSEKIKGGKKRPIRKCRVDHIEINPGYFAPRYRP